MRGLDADIQSFQALDALLFKTHTATLICDWSEDIHDRSLRTDNGSLLKFGRGLDIYQFATGLAAREPGLRAVKACEIYVFGPAAAERGLASRMGVQAPDSANAT
jgi:hypothetical protein